MILKINKKIKEACGDVFIWILAVFVVALTVLSVVFYAFNLI